MNDIELLKKLRDEIGAGVLDCRNAIKESNGDYDKAVEILRTKGLSSAKKKVSREASEFLIAIKVNDSHFSAIELACETDFVIRNEKFQNLASFVSDFAIEHPSSDLDVLKDTKCRGNETLQEYIMSTAGVIGENIELKKVYSESIKDKSFGLYVHNIIDSSVGLFGKIACIVIADISEGNSDSNKNKLNALLKQVAMHVVASNPIAISVSDVSNDLIDKERAIYLEQLKSSGKNDDVIQKIAEGKLKKFMSDNVLMEQLFVIDNKTKISDLISDFEKENNMKIKIEKFIRI